MSRTIRRKNIHPDRYSWWHCVEEKGYDFMRTDSGYSIDKFSSKPLKRHTSRLRRTLEKRELKKSWWGFHHSEKALKKLIWSYN